MNQKRFSIELKISFSLAIILMAFACRRAPAPAPKVDPLASLSRTTVAPEDIPLPPWAVWRRSADVDPILQEADAIAESGELEEALIRYQDLATRSELRAVRSDLVIRELGVLLQLGQSKRVLQRASGFLKEEGFSLASAPSGISLMIAYAYLHQNNIDQTIAWFLKSMQGSDPGRFSAQAKTALSDLVASFSPADFSRHNQRWQADTIVGKVFTRERIRRSRGGAIQAALSPALFSAQTYRIERPAQVQLAALSSSPQEGELQAREQSPAEASLAQPEVPPGQRKIGVLLPLSGQFTEHALKVKQGIELAAASASPPMQVEVVDTKGDPAIAEQGYLSLVQSGASVILGPLLVKTTEQVASRTLESGVPIVSFTKRAGVPQLGPSVFRLGVTLENQIDELLQYAMNQIGARRFAVLFPETASGQEFAYYFRQAVSAQGGILVADQSYYPGDEPLIESSVRAVALAHPDAIFIPDQLDFALPLLNALEQSESTESVLLGPALWDDPVAIRGFGQLLDGAVFVTPFYRASPLPEIIQFSERYRAQFSTTPELLAAQSFDATNLVIGALDTALRNNTSVVNTLSYHPDISGVTGLLKVSKDGEIVRRMSVLRLYKGEIIEVMTRGTVTGFSPNQSTMSSLPAAAGYDSRVEQAE